MLHSSPATMAPEVHEYLVDVYGADGLSSRTISGSVTHSVMRGVAVLPPRSLPGVLTRFPVGQLRDADWPCVVAESCCQVACFTGGWVVSESGAVFRPGVSACAGGRVWHVRTSRS